MKTLVNKANPAFRIITPEIIEEEEYYTLDGETVFLKENWTLVEEESKHTEVWVEGRTFFEQDAKKPEVDLEREIEKWITPSNTSIDPKKGTISREVYIDCIIVTARHFYELGLNARKED